MHCISHSVVLAIVLSCCSVRPCGAHQKWLWPNVFAAPKAPVWISFDVTWSDTPFTAESGVGDQPLLVIGPQGDSNKPSNVFVGKTKSTAEVELTKPGTYCLQAIDPLTYWTRIEEGGKQQWLKKAKNEVTGAKITRSDLYWSKAFAYVTVGEATDFPRPNDEDPLDIVPATHPNTAVAGREMELRVRSYGKPVPRAELKIFGAEATGHDPTQTIQCDEQGIGKLSFDAPGRHLVACEYERKVADDPKADLHAYNVYLTLLIQPRTK